MNGKKARISRVGYWKPKGDAMQEKSRATWDRYPRNELFARKKKF